MATSPAALGSKLSPSVQNLLRQITLSSPITTTVVSAKYLLIDRCSRSINNNINQVSEATRTGDRLRDLHLFGMYCWPATVNNTMKAGLADVTLSELEARGRKVVPDEEEFEKDEYDDGNMTIDDDEEIWDEDEDEDDEDDYCSDDFNTDDER